MDDFRAVDTLEAYAAAAAGFRGVTHDQVGIDHQVADRCRRPPCRRHGCNPHQARRDTVGSVSGAPMTRRPPPLLGVVGLVLWLNRIVLCSMLPF